MRIALVCGSVNLTASSCEIAMPLPLFDRPPAPYDPKPSFVEHPERATFDGETFDPAVDQARLAGQLGRVWALMSDGQWRTLAAIAAATESSEAAVSARLRDFRKPRFGGYQVDRRRVAGGLFEYRVQR